MVVKVFTRQFGVKSYIIKGVRGHNSRVKQNMLQPLSSLDMVVYDSRHNDLNHVKELSPRHPVTQTIDQSSGQAILPSTNQAISNSLRFFKTEVLYKALREEEPMPELFDYVESAACETKDEPIVFLLTVARYLGIEPLDNYSQHNLFFDLQEGRYGAQATETTLSPALSSLLHEYLQHLPSFYTHTSPLSDRRSLIDALIAYYQLHLSGFRNFNSHEILHTVLK